MTAEARSGSLARRGLCRGRSKGPPVTAGGQVKRAESHCRQRKDDETSADRPQVSAHGAKRITRARRRHRREDPYRSRRAGHAGLGSGQAMWRSDAGAQPSCQTERGPAPERFRSAPKRQGNQGVAGFKITICDLEGLPPSFMFALSRNEATNLISQSATSSSRHGGRHKLPYAFTEDSAVALAGPLLPVCQM